MTGLQWRLLPEVPRDALVTLGDFPPLGAQLLYNRGIRDRGQASAFLSGEGAGWHDPFALPDMERAVQRLERALRGREQVVVYGDFDADGITGTALLVQGLASLGIDAHPYIPHRDSEGYGLNIPALEALHTAGAGLVISVDCGTSSVEEIAHARALGLDVVVVDHHAIPPQLPPAVALINPHREESAYPFSGLSGVGVAFKLLQALRLDLGEKTEGLQEHLDLVAIGTVADIAPLQDENRRLVQQGLRVIRSGARLGLRALAERVGLDLRAADASHIGYTIAPRLNAMGRLEHAMASYRLLVTEDPAEAAGLAEQLDATNRERQRLTQEALARAREALEKEPLHSPLVMVEGDEYPEGVVGLVASRLAEERYRPAVVIATGPGESRGSARSIPGFSIVAALGECRDLFVRYGGHAQAAGFTIENTRLPELRQRLSAIAARELDVESLRRTLWIDAAVALHALPGPTMSFIQQLGPFGAENPEPLFLSRDLRVLEARAIGVTGDHLELKLRDGRAAWRAMGFGMGGRLQEIAERVDIVYTVGVNRWNGQDLLQLRLQDWRPATAGRPAGAE